MDDRFEELVRANRVGLVGYLCRYVDISTAEELAADAFVALWRRLPALRDDNLRAYLYAAGRNGARNYLRRQRKILSFDEMPREMPAADPELDEALIRDEEGKAVHTALGTIAPDYRGVLHLLYFCDLSPAEVGHILGKSPKQVANLTYRAKEALRRVLTEMGMEPSFSATREREKHQDEN